jgi:hypothetical protein
VAGMGYEDEYSANNVYTLWNAKILPVKIVPGIGEGGMKEGGGGVEFKYDIFDTL